MVLLKYVEGESIFNLIVKAMGYASRAELRSDTCLCTIDYSLLPPESERLNVLAAALEAETRLFSKTDVR